MSYSHDVSNYIHIISHSYPNAVDILYSLYSSMDIYIYTVPISPMISPIPLGIISHSNIRIIISVFPVYPINGYILVPWFLIPLLGYYWYVMEDDIPDHIPYFLYFQPKFPIIFPMGISPWLRSTCSLICASLAVAVSIPLKALTDRPRPATNWAEKTRRSALLWPYIEVMARLLGKSKGKWTIYGWFTCKNGEFP